jgi:hypothetical protein
MKPNFGHRPTPFEPEATYQISGSVLACIWREVYLRLIEEGYPFRGDDRRDMAQRLGGLLEGNADRIT